MTGEQGVQSTGARTILVVEDDRSIADLIAEILELEGYVVDVARDGVVALDHLRARPYALVLTDLRLPALDGVGLYRALERSYPHLCQRTIFITGYPLTPETQMFEDRTGAPILRKPFRVEDLLHLVRLLITAHP